MAAISLNFLYFLIFDLLEVYIYQNSILHPEYFLFYILDSCRQLPIAKADGVVLLTLSAKY